jgi:hypothetical protein
MSKIEDRVIAKIEARAAVGKKKYGTTMERKDLTFRQWITNLQEELLDAVIYAEKALELLALLGEIKLSSEKEVVDNDVPAMAHELPKAIDAWGIYDEEMILIKSCETAYMAIEEANIMNLRNKNKTFVVKKYTLYLD